MEKEDTTVLAIKLKTGEDILGYYAGELEQDYAPGEMTVMLYRPIKIMLQSELHERGVVSNYIPQFYFPYGEVLTPIPYSMIAHQELANPFFVRLYKKTLGELIVFEESRQERITKVFDLDDMKTAMCDSESPLIFMPTRYLQ
jgi:hypothetical protein